jgi:hypothetical protein
MERRHMLKGVMLLMAMGAMMAQSQTPAKLAIDATKPIVYIEFNHAGLREPVEEGEPVQGLWLLLVNNSVVPIEVETMDTATQAKLTLLPDVITPIERKIPRSGVSQDEMPVGYGVGMGVVHTIAPGKHLVFSVPSNHVSPNWFLQVPFHFGLPPVQKGGQPICYASFTWDDLPDAYRSAHAATASEQASPTGTLLHESGHTNPPKPQ